MRWASAASDKEAFSSAVDRVLDVVQRGLDDEAPDLVLAFASPHHSDHFHDLVRLLESCFAPAVVIGASASGVIGGGQEVEEPPGLGVVAATLPDVQVVPFRADAGAAARMLRSDGAWNRHLDLLPEQQPCFLLLGEPSSTDVDVLLRGLDAAFPGCPKVGGLASGGESLGEHALFYGDEVLRTGAVGVGLVGDVALDTIVAQGTRPVGPAVTVTRHTGNLVHQLDNRPAVDILDQVYAGLGPRDQDLLRRSPLVGVEPEPAVPTIDEGPSARAGELLVRGILGLDRSTGVIAIAAPIFRGQSLQFHVRDPVAASEEVDALLRRHARDGGPRPAGALLFSCRGRGARFYGVADHDSRAFEARVGPVPVGGLFCNGEIAPIHQRTALHTWTSVFGLFRPRGWS